MPDPRVENVRRQVDAVVSVATANRSTMAPVTLDAHVLYYLLDRIETLDLQNAEGIKRIEALNRLEAATQAYMETHNHVYAEPRCGMMHPCPEWRGRTAEGARAVWAVLEELESLHD